MQSMLAELGYDPGPADGLMGRRTRNAIRSYQLHSGMGTTGEPSTELHSALSEDLGYADSSSSTAEPAAEPEPQVTVTPRGSSSAGAASSRPIYVQEAERGQQAQTPVRSSTPSFQTRTTPRRTSQQRRSGSDPGNPVDRLRTIIDEGEQRGAVRGRYLRRLRDLVDRHDYRWRDLVVEDTFSDGDYTRRPTWDVLSGQFWVHGKDGLRSQVKPGQATTSSNAPQQSQSRGTSGKEIGIALLSALLKQQGQGNGSSSGGSASLEPQDAEIRLSSTIPGSFALDVSLVSGEATGRVEMGVFQRGRSDRGYRLAYLPGAQNGLELSRVSNGQQSILELSANPLQLEDRQAHAIKWTRDNDGYMRISVDGKELIAISDRGITGNFDGVVIINRGGNIGIRSIRVHGEGN
ncbi:MAG: peptidoglycan-binding protein [Chromatiales bacterium]|nr:peptidoglycan-binding protein [Chromatiales bacterium]